MFQPVSTLTSHGQTLLLLPLINAADAQTSKSNPVIEVLDKCVHFHKFHDIDV